MARVRRRAKKFVRKADVRLVATGLALVLAIVVIAMTTKERRLEVDPASYAPLLDLIASVESRNNYNAYFGNAHNAEIEFTNMTIAEVRAWQEEYTATGAASSAVGRYQIINTTLESLVEELELDDEQPFNKATQDTMAMALVERRGSEAYVNSELTDEQFAAQLAKEWAALPSVVGEHPEQSYYAGDGLNKSLVEVEEILQAVRALQPQ